MINEYFSHFQYQLIAHTNQIINKNKKYSLLIRNKTINDSIISAIKQGIVQEIIATKDTLDLYENFQIIKTKTSEPYKIWSDYAFHTFPKQPNHIISITGTNGKSSTCFYISQFLTLLNLPNIYIGTIGTYINGEKKQYNNNTTPDAYLLHQQLQSFTEKFGENSFAIIEVSSIGIDQYRNHNIKSSISLITNFSEDHLAFHKTMENYLKIKLKIGENSDQCFAHYSIKQNQYIKYGEELKEYKYDQLTHTSHYTFTIDKTTYKSHSSLLGEFNANNILSALTALKKFIPIQKLIQLIPQLKAAEGRMQIYNNFIIDYAHTLDGVQNVFHAIKEHVNHIIVVIGFGGGSGNTRINQISEFLKNNADTVIFTTDNPRNEDPLTIALKAQAVCPKAIIELDRYTALKKAYQIAKKNDIILALGKGHEPYMVYKNSLKVNYSEKDTIMQIIKKLS